MEILKPKDVSKILKVTTKTLREWEAKGKLVSHRTATNRRYYLKNEIYDFLNLMNRVDSKTVIYARESTSAQRAELKTQIESIKSYCVRNKIEIDEVVTDIGSGLNFDRPNWNKMLERVESLEISKIVVSYRDRFTRFGFDWFARYCKRFGCEVIVINDDKTKSADQEMVDDLIAIIHVFSSKFYGMRKYKGKDDL